jgi:2-phosphosulfolactate phosphatase
VHFNQVEYDLRCEWGIRGVRSLAPISDAIVIVDILSFSTAVDIAVANGASVIPYRWKDDSARAFARSKQALLAQGRRSSAGPYTLSPSSLQSIPSHTALVLPSPNGSSISLSTGRTPTFTACLRNAPAVARQLAKSASTIGVVPAGEQWNDGTLRPSLEDLLGAGAVLAELPGTCSPEAELAIAAFERFRDRLHQVISRCGSGRELLAGGFSSDLELAADYAASGAVPFFVEDRFVDRGAVPLG